MTTEGSHVSCSRSHVRPGRGVPVPASVKRRLGLEYAVYCGTRDVDTEHVQGTGCGRVLGRVGSVRLYYSRDVAETLVDNRSK